MLMQNECGAFLLVSQTEKKFLCNFLLHFWSFVLCVCPSCSFLVSISFNIAWWWLSQRKLALSVFSQGQHWDWPPHAVCWHPPSARPTGARQARMIDLQVLVLTRTRQSGGNKWCHGYYRIWIKTGTHNALALPFQTLSRKHTHMHMQRHRCGGKHAGRHTNLSFSFFYMGFPFSFVGRLYTGSCDTEQDE